MAEDKKFTKIATDLMVNVRDLANWGIETENTTLESLRMSYMDRRSALPKMIEAGMKHPQIAKIFGVSRQMIEKDLEATGLHKKATGVARNANEKRRKAELETVVASGLVPDLHVGDFRKLAHEIADDSAQLVFTDPPYDGESIELYRDAAAHARRILKPGGSFIAYSGQRHLPEVLYACTNAGLRYWWTIAGVHGGGNQILNKLGIRCGWKPLVWFVKGTRGDVQNVLFDTITGEREKKIHEWQQSEGEARYYIEELTTKDGLVVDFFVGGGTTMAACKALGRRCIGFEIDPEAANKAAARIAA